MPISGILGFPHFKKGAFIPWRIRRLPLNINSLAVG